jgi:hypothetical protein
MMTAVDNVTTCVPACEYPLTIQESRHLESNLASPHGRGLDWGRSPILRKGAIWTNIVTLSKSQCLQSHSVREGGGCVMPRQSLKHGHLLSDVWALYSEQYNDQRHKHWADKGCVCEFHWFSYSKTYTHVPGSFRWKLCH